MSGICYSFDVELACRYGLNEAIFLERLKQWLSCPGTIVFEERKFAYMPLDDQLRNHFSFWTEHKLQKTIQSLLASGVILGLKPQQGEETPWMSNWYALADGGGK